MVAMFGPIIAAPLANPVTRERRRTARVATLMPVSVVRMACAASSSASRPGCGLARRLRDAGLEHRHRQRPADHARWRRRAPAPAEQPSSLRDQFGHPARVGQPLLAGAGVGVAGTDDDRAGVGPREPLAADLHRRGADAVLREHAGRGRRAVADDDRQVAPVRLGPQAADDARVPVAAGEVPFAHAPIVSGRRRREKAWRDDARKTPRVCGTGRMGKVRSRSARERGLTSALDRHGIALSFPSSAWERKVAKLCFACWLVVLPCGAVLASKRASSPCVSKQRNEMRRRLGKTGCRRASVPATQHYKQTRQLAEPFETMTDGDALYRAILAAPEEDTPRLVYADWLDENGQPNRAEFIRVQIELAQIPPSELVPWNKRA